MTVMLGFLLGLALAVAAGVVNDIRKAGRDAATASRYEATSSFSRRAGGCAPRLNASERRVRRGVNSLNHPVHRSDTWN